MHSDGHISSCALLIMWCHEEWQLVESAGVSLHRGEPMHQPCFLWSVSEVVASMVSSSGTTYSKALFLRLVGGWSGFLHQTHLNSLWEERIFCHLSTSICLSNQLYQIMNVLTSRSCPALVPDLSRDVLVLMRGASWCLLWVTSLFDITGPPSLHHSLLGAGVAPGPAELWWGVSLCTHVIWKCVHQQQSRVIGDHRSTSWSFCIYRHFLTCVP